ncbi:MAG TPA: rhodanese-like domain-containing protein [Burkholderiales bacterium]|nr:rhodanese-like domain-containing protein [Burkholderiales bacterium]
MAQVDAAELERMLSSGQTELLDVRTDVEVARGMIAGAKHIPLHLLPVRAAELDPTRPLVIYCLSGARSAQACAWLGERGFDSVYNLQGGVLAWLREGRGLVE